MRLSLHLRCSIECSVEVDSVTFLHNVEYVSSLASWHLNIEVHFGGVLTLVHFLLYHIDHFINECLACVAGDWLFFIWNFRDKCVRNSTWTIELCGQRFKNSLGSPGIGSFANVKRLANRLEMRNFVIGILRYVLACKHLGHRRL